MSGVAQRVRRWGHRWFWISIPLGIVAGIVSGLALWEWQLDRERADFAERARVLGQGADTDLEAPPPPGEELRAVLAQDGPVVIAPDVADQVSQEQVARATEILTESGMPLHLAFLRKPGYVSDGYTTAGAIATWAHGVGEDGHYVVLWTGGRADSLSVGYDDEHVWEEAEGQPGPALVRVAEAMTQFDLDPPDDGTPVASRDDRDYWGGAGGGVGLAFLVITFVLLPVYGVLWNVLGRRGPKSEGE